MLFRSDESRAEAALSKIRDIPISEIDEFPDHPFKVLMDDPATTTMTADATGSARNAGRAASIDVYKRQHPSCPSHQD